MTTFYQTFFPGTSLPTGLTRRNIVSGDETYHSPSLSVTGLAQGDFYLLDCPSGDFSAELEYTGWSSPGSFMCGVAILDGSGNGVLSSPFNSVPSEILNLGVSGYSYSGSFTSAGGSLLTSARIRITKTGSNYTTAYSTNGGSSWSSESSALSSGITPTKVGIGSIFGANGSITLVELLVKTPTNPDATVSAVAATATATAVAPSASATSGVAAVAATATATAVPPTVTGTGDATVLPPAASATASAFAPTLGADADVTAVAATATAATLPPSLARSATVSPSPAIATADAIAPFVDDGSGSQTVLAPAATATATALAPTVVQILSAGTDTTNTANGRDRRARATVTITRPVAAVPATLTLATKVDKAIAYPAPVMVDGRPT